MSSGWSIFVIAFTVFNLLGIAWLLWWTSKRRPGDPKPEDTSHYWDGDITEYNKPMPRWWINGFFISIAFGVGYLTWYGGWGGFAGMSGWTSKDEYSRAKAAADARLDETFAQFAGKPIDVIARDPRARRLGQAIFANTCATCHGSAARGAIGYPNLADDIWKWGATPDDVLRSVQDGREGVMPPWGTVLTGMGGPNAVDQVVAYVRTLGKPELMQNNFLAAQGKALYDGVCVACHGKDGKGNQELGAPDLTDDDWLYGNSSESLHKTIADGRHGIMPPHLPILGDTRTRLVAAYVWSLSHAEPAAAAKP
jgi:cytochrome c oxidase cbb3-type subunit 3